MTKKHLNLNRQNDSENFKKIKTKSSSATALSYPYPTNQPIQVSVDKTSNVSIGILNWNHNGFDTSSWFISWTFERKNIRAIFESKSRAIYITLKTSKTFYMVNIHQLDWTNYLFVQTNHKIISNENDTGKFNLTIDNINDCNLC